MSYPRPAVCVRGAPGPWGYSLWRRQLGHLRRTPLRACLPEDLLRQIQEMVHSEVAAYDSSRPGPLLSRPAMLASHMSALSQSQLISQMGLRSGIAHSSPSPPGSKSATPSPSSSTQEEESEAHFKMSGEKRPSADPGKKAKNPKKKKKKDPNEPQKPVSAYALFFRDTQAAIKGQNPSATFGDVSKIVASMWDSLGEEQKQAYKRKTEAAKKEYLKALAAYRASLVSKSSPDPGETKSTQASPPAKMLPPKQPMYAMPGLASFLTPSDLQAFRSGASPASLARTLGSKSLLPGLSASPPAPPSFPLSPPLHQQLPLPPHAQGALLSPPVSMSPAPQPPVLPTPMALQVQLAMSPSPPGPQDFPHISEFPGGSGSRSPGPSNPTSSGDWDSSYPSGECGISTCRPQRQPAARRQPREPAGTFRPLTCLLQGYCGPRSSPCTPYPMSGRLAPAHAPVGCPWRGRLPTETHPEMPGAGASPATDVQMRFYSVNKRL
nr:TOX high mobility group box family member 2 isoform X8 [Equus asinus]